ncbi:unnamed protein product [Brassicogethes aeneus]|uniref:Protein FAM98A n=1 Tax=Brassicogethes aeneus TaxID=1431903 RepID=A0A9P0APB1_BRAAE|nr:unnamed protein product [Brassicogethes aeneus]
MIDKIIRALEAVGYKGLLINKTELIAAIDGGQKSIPYTELVKYVTNEIRTLSNIDEEVNAISTPEDSVSFVMELSSFLKELNCPYRDLTKGHVSDRLQNTSDRLTVLDYLLTELMGARITQETKPEKKIELKLQETSEAADMRIILQTLRFPKPPANISIPTLFQKLVPTVGIVLQKAGVNLVGEGIFKGELSNQQWETLSKVQEDLNNEYKIRREMILTRLDVTVQSFQWSDKTKGKDELFEKLYVSKRKMLKVEPDVDLSDLLAARTDLAIIEKTSNSSVRKNTRTSLNKVIIGKVPDRGGRTSEQAPPPPEMPSWQQRSAGPAGGGGRGGGRGAGRGGGNFQRGDNSGGNQGGYSGGNQAYGGGGNSSRAYDSAGGYSIETKYGGSNNSGYNKGGHDGNRGGYSRGGNDNRSGYNSSYSDNRSDYSDSSGYRGNNSTGGYDNSNRRDSYNEQTSKRAKTYDSYQSNKTTYADQYVQESTQNQQYQSRGQHGGGRGGGRGRSNYGRGRGSNSHY